MTGIVCLSLRTIQDTLLLVYNLKVTTALWVQRRANRGLLNNTLVTFVSFVVKVEQHAG